MVREFLYLLTMEEKNLSEKSKVQLDVKALIGMVVGIVSIAGVWFTLQGEIAQLQLDVVRMQDDVELNHEFRVKWPRGEMGALPDDAKQDLRIEYLQEEVKELKKTVKILEIENAKK
jgi:cell division protein FtsL|tara:strand:- start:192 stop:542 length:351 start_codon:yes stop_codon:yes gene_type:complete